MKKLTIDRKIWLRGEGSVRSKLLRPEDQKRCCIGIYLESCSVPKETLLNKGTYYGIAQWGVLLPEETAWLHSYVAQAFYTTNDDQTLTEEEREQKLTALFAGQGIEVEFIN